jgi:hypothetical protein
MTDTSDVLDEEYKSTFNDERELLEPSTRNSRSTACITPLFWAAFHRALGCISSAETAFVRTPFLM